MRPLPFALALTLLLVVGLRPLPVSRAAAQPAGCGSDRPDVATLTDAKAGDVDLTQLIGVNISTLAAIPPPDPLPDNARYDPYETTIYGFRADLLKAHLQDDGEIVLVVQDPNTDDSMTVYFPDAATCATGAAPQLLDLMQQARDAFVQAYGMPSSSGYTPLSGTATVIGVGFLDQTQGQEGEAPNGFELRPVLQFQTSNAAAPGSPLVRGSGEAALSPLPITTSAPSTRRPAALQR